jgi:hypothetical protein
MAVRRAVRRIPNLPNPYCSENEDDRYHDISAHELVLLTSTALAAYDVRGVRHEQVVTG